MKWLRVHPHGRPSGSVLLIVLLVLTAVSVLGIMSLSTSHIESRLARNEREIREAFYLSEGAALEGLQHLLKLESIDVQEGFPAWLHSRNYCRSRNISFRNPRQWETGGEDEDNCRPSLLDSDTLIAAVGWDVATGGSLIATDSRLYVHRIYSLCRKKGAEKQVEIGYAKRY